MNLSKKDLQSLMDARIEQLIAEKEAAEKEAEKHNKLMAREAILRK